VELWKKDKLKELFKGKRIAIIGSAPSATRNKGHNIDNYDYVIRVNNYKIKNWSHKLGTRCDVHYAFYGTSIKKSIEELQKDKCMLHMCKCPNDKCHESYVSDKGGNFKWIYDNRKFYWGFPVYIPPKEDYMKIFEMLDRHVPTTGFSCICAFIDFEPSELYITGFDFFTSHTHNLNEPWKNNNPSDPIGHKPMEELRLLMKFASEYSFVNPDRFIRGIYSELLCIQENNLDSILEVQEHLKKAHTMHMPKEYLLNVLNSFTTCGWTVVEPSKKYGGNG